MKKIKVIFAASVLAAAYSVTPIQSAHAHGWVEYPEARQSICYEEGGLWDGVPPNAACAQAKSISGNYPFVQRNEFAINIDNYNDIESVKAAIPDGTLCYANDAQKKGMGAEHSGWTRTSIQSGTLELVFNATAPHNPSFWEFYLTKPGVDTSLPLTWGDLELIQEYGNITVDSDKKYRMDISIPADRTGDAILYTRWQRDDAAGEGFYNCSDITIAGDTPPVDPDTPYLKQGEAFIPSDVLVSTPELGELVNYKVFNDNGVIHASFSVEITEENKADWDRLLASQVNGYYQSNYEGDVFIGRWHEEMSHYMYFRDELHNNYFNAKDAGGYGEFSISQNDNQIAATIEATVLAPIANAKVEHGDVAVLIPSASKGEIESVTWKQISGNTVNTELGKDDELIINTQQLENIEQQFSFELTVYGNDSSDSVVYSFTLASDNVDPSPGDTWSASAIYDVGQSVTHNGQVWTAHWWTQGEEPGTTGEWGVWR